MNDNTRQFKVLQKKAIETSLYLKRILELQKSQMRGGFTREQKREIYEALNSVVIITGEKIPEVSKEK